MKVLLLGEAAAELVPVMQAEVSELVERCEPLDAAAAAEIGPDLTVSYGFRHIVPVDALAVLGRRVYNLHISLLPWNRGADPNFWSFFEDTPKGVTIHRMVAGLDSGDIVAQREVAMDMEADTLSSSYGRLHDAMLDLFGEVWPKLVSGNAATPQGPGGSCHRSVDLEPHRHLLADQGWDTPVKLIHAAGLALRTGEK